MCTGPTGHFVGNFHKVLDRGFADIRREAQEGLNALEGRCFGNDAKTYTFYKAITIVCDAACILPKRYAAECRRLAESEAGSARKAELLKMADSLDWIVENPCRSFYEAVQAVYLYQLLLILDGNMHGLTYGRIDQYIGKYYDADAEAGRITRAEAQEIVDCLFLKISDCSKAWAEKRAQRGGGYTSGQHATLGGVKRDGSDATNEASYMMLEASAGLTLHEPPLSLRIHKGTPDKLFECAYETTKRCGGIPTLQNDDIIIPTLMKDGLSREDANNYCIIGCVEPTGCGDHWAACGGSGKETYWNMANALLLSINNGINPITGKQGPIQCGYLYDMKSFDEVKEAYEKTVNYYADWQITMTNFYELLAAEMMPLPIVSATMDGCMEKGLDVTWGGAKYNSTGTSGIGCANVADSLSAIKYLVFDTKKYTAREFYEAMISDWEGKEPMRQEVLNGVPRYGNDDAYVDELARWSMDVFAKRVSQGTGFRGKYRPGDIPGFRAHCFRRKHMGDAGRTPRARAAVGRGVAEAGPRQTRPRRDHELRCLPQPRQLFKRNPAQYEVSPEVRGRGKRRPEAATSRSDLLRQGRHAPAIQCRKQRCTARGAEGSGGIQGFGHPHCGLLGLFRRALQGIAGRPDQSHGYCNVNSICR
jgi:formate C-acetyltransferase